MQGKNEKLSSGIHRRRSWFVTAPHHQRDLRPHARNGVSVPPCIINITGSTVMGLIAGYLALVHQLAAQA
jgi:hypothetical protein